MSDAPVQVIVGTFNDEDAARKMMEQLGLARGQKLIEIDDIAVVRRDAHNKLHIWEPSDQGAGRGGYIGGIIGFAVGALAGGPLVGAAAGAGVGALMAKLHDGGIPNDRLKELGASLRPGTSAIVTVIEDQWVADVEKRLQDGGAEVKRQALAADVADQLAEHRDDAYTAVRAQDGTVVAGSTDAPGTSTGSSEPR
jgi:uncharacterized membrane protein